MSATFIERVIAVGDYGEDGGAIDPVAVHCLLTLYVKGDRNAAYLKSAMSLTTPQGDQLDSILATQPNVGITILSGVVASTWADGVYSVLMLGRMAFSDYDTNAKRETALGI